MTCGAPAEIDSLSSLSSPLTTERNRTREPRVRPHPELPAQVALLRLAALRARRDALRGHDDLHLVVGPSIDRSIDRSIVRSTLDRPSPRSLRTNSRVFGVCVSSARRRRSPLPALLSGRAATARGAAARRPHTTGHPQDVRSVDHEKRTHARAALVARARARVGRRYRAFVAMILAASIYQYIRYVIVTAQDQMDRDEVRSRRSMTRQKKKKKTTATTRGGRSFVWFVARVRDDDDASAARYGGLSRVVRVRRRRRRNPPILATGLRSRSLRRSEVESSFVRVSPGSCLIDSLVRRGDER